MQQKHPRNLFGVLRVWGVWGGFFLFWGAKQSTYFDPCKLSICRSRVSGNERGGRKSQGFLPWLFKRKQIGGPIKTGWPVGNVPEKPQNAHLTLVLSQGIKRIWGSEAVRFPLKETTSWMVQLGDMSNSFQLMPHRTGRFWLASA